MANQACRAKLAIIISHPTRLSGIIVSLQGCALAAPGHLRRLTFGLTSGRIDFGLCENPKRNQQTYRNGTERNKKKLHRAPRLPLARKAVSIVERVINKTKPSFMQICVYLISFVRGMQDVYQHHIWRLALNCDHSIKI